MNKKTLLIVLVLIVLAGCGEQAVNNCSVSYAPSYTVVDGVTLYAMDEPSDVRCRKIEEFLLMLIEYEGEGNE